MFKHKLVLPAIAGLLVITGGVLFSNLLHKNNPDSHQGNIIIQNHNDGLNSDACIQFPKEFLASIIGQPILRTNNFNYGSHYGCVYFTSQSNVNQMFLIDINQGSAAEQKTANEYLGFKAQSDDRIPMDNFIVWQDGTVLNKLYLVIDANNFIIINRSGADVLDNDKIIKLAIAISQKLKNESVNSTVKTVPLPQETDIVRTFFNLIDEHRPADAVSMLTPDQIVNNSQKQTWAVMFNAFDSVKIIDIESSSPEDWSSDRHNYKVTLNVTMKPETAHAAIPFYGYQNGTNVRFITLQKNGDLWKINGIATGP